MYELTCGNQNVTLEVSKDISQIAEADYFLVHLNTLWWKNAPRKWNLDLVKNYTRDYSHNTTFVWYTKEGPLSEPDIKDPDILSMFNMSWSYLRSAEVWSPYQHLHDWLQALELEFDLKREFEKRKRNILWLCSNCPSGKDREIPGLERMMYVKALLEVDNTSVHARGKCLRNGAWLPGSNRNQGDICSMASEYMFYSSLENTFSTDYITEKFYHGFRCGTIPIIYSKDGIPDYTKKLPIGSFININDFDTAEDLLLHVQDIASNFTLFSQYHQFRMDKNKTEQYFRDIVFPRPTDMNYKMCSLLEASKRKQKAEIEVAFGLMDHI